MNYWLEQANKSQKQKELEELVERLAPTKLLDGIEDEYIKQQVALILENQKLMNEISTEISGYNSGDNEVMCRISIPILRRVFGGSEFEDVNPLFHLISVQGMFGPNGRINVGGEEEFVSAKTRKMKTIPPSMDVTNMTNMDVEAKITEIITQEMRAEIIREVMTDLRNNVGTVITPNGATKDKCILTAIDQIKRKTSKEGNFWIAGNFENVKTYMGIHELDLCGEPPVVPTLYKTLSGSVIKHVLVDEEFPENEILVGMKGEDHFDAGYFYCPYVMCSPTPPILDPEGFCPRRGILCRYGKKMPWYGKESKKNGSRFYAKIILAQGITPS